MKQPLIILVFIFPLCPNFTTAQGNDNVNLVDLEYLYQGNRINVFDLRPREQEGTRFINPSNFNAGGYALNIGFLQEIHSGEMSLFSARKAELVRPDHVPVLSTGSTRSRVIRRKKYFLYDGKRLVEIPKKKSKIIELLETYQAGVSAYVKKEKLNVKREKELLSLIQWFTH